MQQSPQTTVDSLARIFAILIYFNLLSIFLFPKGIFAGAYPLGRNYNQIGATLLCGMTTYIVAYHMQLRNLISTILLCSVCVITPLIFGSMTSTVGCVLVLLFFLVPNKKIRRIILSSFLIFYLLFQYFVIFAQTDLSDNKEITYFVEDVLKKDLTFTDRARVWMTSLDLIQDSPRTGYGLRPTEWFDDHLNVLSSHNIVLQILIYGGYVTLLAFIGIIILAIKRSLQHRTQVNDAMLFGVGTFFFMMMMENYNIVLIFYMLAILFYTPELSVATEQISPQES